MATVFIPRSSPQTLDMVSTNLDGHLIGPKCHFALAHPGKEKLVPKINCFFFTKYSSNSFFLVVFFHLIKSSQSYKVSTIVNYDSRVKPDLRLKSRNFMIIESS